MELLELVRAVLNQDDLAARQWVKDSFRAGFQFHLTLEPVCATAQELSLAAALVCLFSGREQQAPPEWVKKVGPMDQTFYVDMKASKRMSYRLWVEKDSPAELLKYNVRGPAKYLMVL